MIRCSVPIGLCFNGTLRCDMWVVTPSVEYLQAVLAPWPTIAVQPLRAQYDLGTPADDFVLPAGTMALVACILEHMGEPT